MNTPQVAALYGPRPAQESEVGTCRLAEWMVSQGERPEITGEAVAYDTALPAVPTGPLDADRVSDAVAIRLIATSANLRRQAEGERSDTLDKDLTVGLLTLIARQLETAASSVERLR